MPIDWYSGKTKVGPSFSPKDEIEGEECWVEERWEECWMPPLQTSTKDDWGYKILDSEEIVEACCDLEEVDICESCQ